MKDEYDSFKEELKNRFTSPFTGKFILAWIVCNWQIFYITFFVDEDKLESKNRLTFIKEYLSIDSLIDFLLIYAVPFFLTCFLVWIFPFFSDLADKANNKFRKKKELNKKRTNDEITGYKEQRINGLEKELESFRRNLNNESNKIKELRLLAEYLSEVPEEINNKSIERSNMNFAEKFKGEISIKSKRDKLFSLLEDYHTTSKGDHFGELEQKDLKFLINNEIIEKDTGRYHLSSYGEFISKNILFNKYHNMIPNFNHWTLLENEN